MLSIVIMYIRDDFSIIRVGHLILNGLVWKPNGQKESKRPWDVKPNGHNMYYKCISPVNKIVFSCLSFRSSCCPCVFNMVSERAIAGPALI